MSSSGKVVKVVKVASNITEEKLESAEFESKINAISRAQAVIEFSPTGDILTANENFLSALGYKLDEVKGKNHKCSSSQLTAILQTIGTFGQS